MNETIHPSYNLLCHQTSIYFNMLRAAKDEEGSFRFERRGSCDICVL